MLQYADIRTPQVWIHNMQCYCMLWISFQPTFTLAETFIQESMSRSCRKVCQTVGKCGTLQGEDRNTMMSPTSLPQMGSCFKGRPRATAPQRTPRNTLDRLESTSSSKCRCIQKKKNKKNNYLADCAASTIMSNIYIEVLELYNNKCDFKSQDANAKNLSWVQYKRYQNNLHWMFICSVSSTCQVHILYICNMTSKCTY